MSNENMSNENMSNMSNMSNEIKINVQGIVKGVYFSLGNTPDSGNPVFSCSKAIIENINNAKALIHVVMYSFTNSNIAKALMNAHTRDVEVLVLVDAHESSSKAMKTLLKQLVTAGVPVKTTVKQKALMHNKVMIIDNETILTGSYNWTYNAEKKNDENMVIIQSKEIAQNYEEYVIQRILHNETLMDFKLIN